MWPFNRKKKWELLAESDDDSLEELSLEEITDFASRGRKIAIAHLIKNQQTNGLEDQVRGQNFYLNTPEEDFTKKVGSWLNYLGINDLVPNLEDLPAKIIEVGDKLRDAGDASYLGLTEKGSNTVLIRPGDYAVLLHELVHAHPKYKSKLISSEAGAFATSIFACGNFEGEINGLINSNSYDPDEKRKGRIVAEASLVLGRRVLDYMKDKDNNTSIVELIPELKELADHYEQEFIASDKTAKDYLMEEHGLTESVAKFLLYMTKDTKETIVTSTSQTKKEIIGSFKSLVSFYHINLNYDLNTAIDKTEEHFLNMEAMSIHKTLTTGAKDVFAKLKEYGYNLDVCRGISEAMISEGATKSISYAEGLPKFLELTGQYGPRGSDLLGFSLKNPNFFDIMCLSDAAKGLIQLSESEPEQVSLVLEELSQYDWNHQLSTNDNTTLSLGYLYGQHRDSMRKLDQKDKATVASLSFYLSSMDESVSKNIFSLDNLLGLERLSSHIGNTYGYIHGKLHKNNFDPKIIYSLVEKTKKKTKKLSPPSNLRLIESKDK